MESAKHIVFVSPGFARDEADSRCTPYLQDFFRALQAARPDWRISIVAMQYPYESREYVWHGIQVYALGGNNRRWMKPLIWRRCRRLLRRIHQAHPIDVLHGFWLGETVSCALSVGKAFGIPVFATLMGQDVLPTNRYLRKLDFAAMTTIALSPFSAELFTRATNRAPDTIIPFGLVPADVDASGNPDRPIDILGVGSLIKAKRLDRFLRVVSHLRERFPELRAVLIGDGADRAALENTILELGLQEHLQFLGGKERPEILAWMSHAKVFLHTSSIEGMGLVLAEALARGCHLVTTQVGIAAPSDKCLLSAHTYGLTECVAHFLEFPVDFQARVPYTVGQTVDAHLDLYGL